MISFSDHAPASGKKLNAARNIDSQSLRVRAATAYSTRGARNPRAAKVVKITFPEWTKRRADRDADAAQQSGGHDLAVMPPNCATQPLFSGSACLKDKRSVSIRVAVCRKSPTSPLLQGASIGLP